MKSLLAIAANTLRHAVRDRVLYSILFFAAGVILLSLALKDVTIGDQDKVVRSIGQSAIAGFGSIIAMFLGVSLVWTELEKRTVYTVLSRPLARRTFILGKYLGLIATLAVQIAIMLTVYTALMTVQQHVPPAIVYVSNGMLLIELMLLTAFATLFSTYSAPTTASAFTLSVFVIGHLADDIWLYGSRAESPAVQEMARALYWVLPNFEILNLRDLAIHEKPIPWDRVLTGITYGLSYTAVVLGAAVAVFERRDLK